MKIVRLFTGNDQKSHFEEIELKFGGNQPPRRQFLVTLSGAWEIEASNAVKRVFKTGDVMLADDTTGEGHISRVLGNEPHVFMTVPLAD